MKTSFTVTNLADDTAEVRLYDKIGGFDGMDAERFVAQFNGISAAKINLRINSMGGDIFDATAICSAIKEHPAEVTAYIDGIAASSASWIAVACDSVVMNKFSFLMIHNPSSAAFGNSAKMRKQADILDKLADTISQVYCGKTGKTKEQVLAAMDAETWFNAAEAKAWGLADSINGDDDGIENAAICVPGYINSLAPLLITKFKNVPASIRQLAAGPRQEKANAMLSIINRDGKSFVNIDGKEHEVGLPQTQVLETRVASLLPPGKSEEEFTRAVNLATAKAKEDAIKEERTYRNLFNTVVASAGLAGESAAKFEKDFYGRAENDLKFLASHAIGNRATAVGEGSGEQEQNPADKSKGPEIQCADRFGKEAGLRRAYNVHTADAASDEYKNGLARFVNASKKYDEDAKPENQRRQIMATRESGAL